MLLCLLQELFLMLQLYQSGMLDLTQTTREALYSAFADPGKLLRV